MNLQEQLATMAGLLDGAAAAALRITAILLLAWLATSVTRRLLRGFHNRLTTRIGDPESVQRAETLARALRYASTVVVFALTTMLVLAEVGVSVAPLLGAAGVAGVAIGFGAQSLVKDYFAGLSLLLEDQVRQGDVVRLGDHAGLVEEVTLRYVRLRDYDGHVHFVPNGTIESVVSMGRHFAFAVVDIGVAYGVNLDEAMATMRDVAAQLMADPEHAERLAGDFELAGVDQWANSAIVIRARFKVMPLQQWTIRRAYLKRLKEAFDAKGIEIPFPHVTVVPKADALGLGLVQALAGAGAAAAAPRAQR